MSFHIEKNELTVWRDSYDGGWCLNSVDPSILSHNNEITSIKFMCHAFGWRSLPSLVSEREDLSTTELANFLRFFPNLTETIFVGRLCNNEEAAVISQFSDIKITICSVQYVPNKDALKRLREKWGFPQLNVDYKPHHFYFFPADLASYILFGGPRYSYQYTWSQFAFILLKGKFDFSSEDFIEADRLELEREYVPCKEYAHLDPKYMHLHIKLQFPDLFRRCDERRNAGTSRDFDNLKNQLESLYGYSLLFNIHASLDYAEIRKNARILVGNVNRQISKKLQKLKDEQSPVILAGIFKLPRELRIKIAAFTGMDSYDEGSAAHLAEEFACKPILSPTRPDII